MSISSSTDLISSLESSSLTSLIPTGSILWTLVSSPQLCLGIITNISVIQGIGWYLPLTFYETVLVGLVIAQISVLQAIGVLPININKALYGDPSGRRKRRSVFKKQLGHEKIEHADKDLTEKMLNALKGLDKHECIFRTLCEIQKQRIWGYKPPNGLELTMDALERLSQTNQAIPLKIRDDYTNLTENTSHTTKVMEPTTAWFYFEEAVQMGTFAARSRNSINCEQRYSHCTVSGEEILAYVEQMHLNDLF